MAPGEGRPDYDQALKRLLTAAHDGVLALLLPGARWLEERHAELLATRRQADLVWLVEIDGERLLLHVELQTNPDPAIGERVAEYGLRVWLRDRLPVYSVVVYLRESGSIRDGVFVIGRGRGREALQYRYEVIRLWQEPAELVLAAAEPGVWPLAALMAGEPAETLERVAERIARAPLPLGERRDLAELLAALAGLRLPRQVVEQVLRRNSMLREIMAESSYSEILLDHFEAQWRAKIKDEERAKIKDEERAEGKAEGRREMVQAVLESRFGTLDPEEVAALRAAEEPSLRALAASIATDSRDRVRARLGLT